MFRVIRIQRETNNKKNKCERNASCHGVVLFSTKFMISIKCVESVYSTGGKKSHLNNRNCYYFNFLKAETKTLNRLETVFFPLECHLFVCCYCVDIIFLHSRTSTMQNMWFSSKVN